MHVLIIICIQVFIIAYAKKFSQSRYREWKRITYEFVTAITRYKPELLKKQKIHLLLHLVDNMQEFGPTSAFVLRGIFHN